MAGIDGLEVIGRLLEQLPAALALGGVALLEIGADQGEAIGLLVGGAVARLAMSRRAGPRRAAAGRRDRARGGGMTERSAVPMTAPSFPIRLIALDIDGTLVDDGLTIGPRTLAAVKTAMDRDVAVSLLTGRMVSSGMRFAETLG